jgi:hypothetical protein
MSTVAQIEANRLNAQASTGPVTDEGKARSSLNALSHGFYSKHLLLPDEDPAELELLRSSLIDSYEPQDGAELLLVERILTCEWKTRRLEKLEIVTVQRGPDALVDLERLSRIAQRLDNTLHKAIKALRELRADKQKQHQREQQEEQPKPNLRNEANSPSKCRVEKGLGLDPHALSGGIDSLAKQLNHDLPHFAATAVAHKAAKLPVTGAATR